MAIGILLFIRLLDIFKVSCGLYMGMGLHFQIYLQMQLLISLTEICFFQLWRTTLVLTKQIQLRWSSKLIYCKSSEFVKMQIIWQREEAPMLYSQHRHLNNCLMYYRRKTKNQFCNRKEKYSVILSSVLLLFLPPPHLFLFWYPLDYLFKSSSREVQRTNSQVQASVSLPHITGISS